MEIERRGNGFTPSPQNPLPITAAYHELLGADKGGGDRLTGRHGPRSGWSGHGPRRPLTWDRQRLVFYPPTAADIRDVRPLTLLKGTLGHEIVGHRAAALAGKTQSVGYLEEAQASIRAARFTPDLSNGERMTLLRDGIGRLNDNGISIRDVKDQLWIKEP